MSKSNIFIANWKMNLSVDEDVILSIKLKESLAENNSVTTVICPPFTHLYSIKNILSGSNILLGAQDMSWMGKGSFTGEIAPFMLKEMGVQYVVIGHSERRLNLKETDEMINKKIKSALRTDLIPILCVGETFEERQQGRKDFVIAGQVESAFAKIQLNGKKIAVAYEPVWVIGSGQAVKIDEAEHAVRVIKQVLLDISPDIDLKNDVDILYGGSVDSKNISYFTESKLINGVLVGGASLDHEEFVKMIKIMNK